MSTVETLVPGYPKLAGQQAKESQLAIYRGFTGLNGRRILHMQAELHKLEQDLLKVERDDSSAVHHGIRPFLCVDWEYLEESQHHTGDEDGAVCKQYRLMQRIDRLLPRYCKSNIRNGLTLRNVLINPDDALRSQREMLGLDEPDPKTLKNLQRFLASANMGQQGLALCGLDCNIWGSIENTHGHTTDLVALIKPGYEDPFSRWCLTRLMDAFWAFGGKRFKGACKVTGDVFYYENQVLRWTYYFTTALASLLLVLAITVLWMVTSMSAQLAIIAAFNVVFSICLAVFTEAPRSQVFGITAA